MPHVPIAILITEFCSTLASKRLENYVEFIKVLKGEETDSYIGIIKIKNGKVLIILYRKPHVVHDAEWFAKSLDNHKYNQIEDYTCSLYALNSISPSAKVSRMTSLAVRTH